MRKYRDQILSAAYALLERNGHTGNVVGDRDFLKTVDAVIDELNEMLGAETPDRLTPIAGSEPADSHTQAARAQASPEVENERLRAETKAGTIPPPPQWWTRCRDRYHHDVCILEKDGGRVEFFCGDCRHGAGKGEIVKQPAPTTREQEELEGDARTLRGYISTYGETPTMTASNRDHWKSRAEAAEAALARAQASPEKEIDIEAMRASLHGTFNGGWHHSEDGMRAFHHGIDTVCNVLAAHQKGEQTNGILPRAETAGRLDHYFAPDPTKRFCVICGDNDGGSVWGFHRFQIQPGDPDFVGELPPPAAPPKET